MYAKAVISRKQLENLLPMLEEPGSRWVFSPGIIKRTYRVEQEPPEHLQGTQMWPKPHGIWYACGAEWAEYMLSDFPSAMNKLVALYKMELGRGVLRLTSTEEILAFDEQYGEEQSATAGRRGGWYIHWDAVSAQYSGIEICPYNWDLRFPLRWYYGWDVASGCIWDPVGIGNLKLVASESGGW